MIPLIQPKFFFNWAIPFFCPYPPYGWCRISSRIFFFHFALWKVLDFYKELKYHPYPPLHFASVKGMGTGMDKKWNGPLLISCRSYILVLYWFWQVHIGRAWLDRLGRLKAPLLSTIGKYFLLVRTRIGVPQIDPCDFNRAQPLRISHRHNRYVPNMVTVQLSLDY